MQYEITREAAKLSSLSSGKIDKNEYRTGEEVLPPDQTTSKEQAKFTYSPLGKALEKQQRLKIWEQNKFGLSKLANETEPSIKYFVPKNNSSTKRIEKRDVKFLCRIQKKNMILQEIKRYALLEMILKRVT